MTVAQVRPRSRIAALAVTIGARVDRSARLILVAVVTVLVAATVLLADRQPLWNDELFTYYISRLPGVDDMWSKLATGVEQTPLTFYLLTRASLEAFGDGRVAMRLPEMAGFVLMTVCLFSFVARRSSPLYGLVGALFPIATIAFGYAYEARAYGLVLGFSAAALLCWQLATDGGPHRRLAALGIAASLAAAVGSHYYAVLVVLALLAGEAVRRRARRRVDWLVLGSLGGALVPLVAFAPLIKEAGDYSTTFWALPTWTSAIRFYPDSLQDRALPIVTAGVLAVGAYAALRRARGAAQRGASLRLPPVHELVALGTLVLLPFFAVALGKLATGAFTQRYSLPALLGVAMLIALAAWWSDGGVPIIGLSLLVVFTAFAGVRIAERYREAKAEAAEQTGALRFLQGHADVGVPIAVASPHDFFELSHRVAREGGPRLVYLADVPMARRYLGTDAVEFGVIGMADIAPLNVEPYRPFLRSGRRLLVYGRDRAWDWLTPALRASGARARVLARSDDGIALFEVSVPR